MTDIIIIYEYKIIDFGMREQIHGLIAQANYHASY